METKIYSKTKEVIIGDDQPTILIGERINPTGRSKLTKALEGGDYSLVLSEAESQVQAGADILDVNIGIAGADEAALLAEAIKQISATIDIPICIDTNNFGALAAALKAYQGKALINSVSGKQNDLREVLPLAKDHNACVIGLCMDDDGIPEDPDRRARIAGKIIDHAVALGFSEQDIIIDCMAMAIGAKPEAAKNTIKTIKLIKSEFGSLTTMGASNISFGLPDRKSLNGAFLTIAIFNGMNCPIVDVARMRQIALSADLLMGKDPYAGRYTTAYRERKS